MGVGCGMGVSRVMGVGCGMSVGFACVDGRVMCDMRLIYVRYTCVYMDV